MMKKPRASRLLEADTVLDYPSSKTPEGGSSMKKLFLVTLSLALLMAFAVGTAGAKSKNNPQDWQGPFDTKKVFETGVAVGDGCIKGEVFIREDGTIKVEIVDPAISAANTYTATVFCGKDNKIFTLETPAKLEDGEVIFFQTEVLSDFSCMEGVRVEISGSDGFQAVSAVCTE
jgi:hypothetical protein